MCNSNYCISGYFAVVGYEEANANKFKPGMQNKVFSFHVHSILFFKCMKLGSEVLTYNFAAPRKPCKSSEQPIRNAMVKKRNKKELNTMTEYF